MRRVTVVLTTEPRWETREYDEQAGEWRAVATGPIVIEVEGSFPFIPAAMIDRFDRLVTNRSEADRGTDRG